MEPVVIYKQPNESEFADIKRMVKDFWLFDENMQPGQFSVLLYNNSVAAFGRLVQHSDATELCTMGVAKNFQGKGLGKKMVKHLLQRADGDVYLVTVIPGFFSKIGFNKVESYPGSLKYKIEVCTKEYHVDEPYFVMRWEKE